MKSQWKRAAIGAMCLTIVLTGIGPAAHAFGLSSTHRRDNNSIQGAVSPSTTRGPGGDLLNLATALTPLPLPAPQGGAPSIASGADGSLWFVEPALHKIGHTTPDGTTTQFVLPTTASNAAALLGLAVDSAGNVWFLSKNDAAIERLSPTGALRRFPLPDHAQPTAIVAKPKGRLWFTTNDSVLGAVTTDGYITEFKAASASALAVGLDGNLWLGESGKARIERVTPTGRVTEFTLPTGDQPASGIAAGSDGNQWFTERNANRIGRITPGGHVTEFSIPGGHAGPNAISPGSDGNLWFTEAAARIGRITPKGMITQYAIPSAKAALSIIAGPKGSLWFTEGAGSRVGRISTVGTISEYPIAAPVSAAATPVTGNTSPASPTVTSTITAQASATATLVPPTATPSPTVTATVPTTPTSYTGFGFTAQLPVGWTVGTSTEGLPLFLSANRDESVSADMIAAPSGFSQTEIQRATTQLVNGLITSDHIQYGVTYQPITIGLLSGFTGVITKPDGSETILLSALTDGTHLLVVQTIYTPTTLPADLLQANQLAASIVPAG